MSIRHARNGDKTTDLRTGTRWGLVAILAALGLVRPLLSIAGAYDEGLGPWGPVVVTALVAALWVGIVVVKRVPNPLLTLLAAGVSYGLLAILLQQTAWHLFLGAPPEEAPSSAPILVVSWVSIVVTNAIWGAFLGLVALGLRRLTARRGPGE